MESHSVGSRSRVPARSVTAGIAYLGNRLAQQLNACRRPSCLRTVSATQVSRSSEGSSTKGVGLWTIASLRASKAGYPHAGYSMKPEERAKDGGRHHSVQKLELSYHCTRSSRSRVTRQMRRCRHAAAQTRDQGRGTGSLSVPLGRRPPLEFPAPPRPNSCIMESLCLTTRVQGRRAAWKPDEE